MLCLTSLTLKTSDFSSCSRTAKPTSLGKRCVHAIRVKSSAYFYQKIKKEDVVSLEESVKAAQVRIGLACVMQYSLASKQHSSILKLAVKPLEAENAALRRRLKVEQLFTLMLANQRSSTGGDDDSVDESFVIQPRIA